MTSVAENKVLTPVSVIMPAYNAEAYIEEAIRSVMAQTYDRWRLLVLDDGSTDGTVERVQQLARQDSRVMLIQNEENCGAARTRNRGMELCHEGYVAFLDSDDVWHPDKLAMQVQKAEHEQAGLVYTAYAIVDADGRPCKKPYTVPERIDLKDLLRENVIGCSTVLLSAEVARKYRFVTDFYHEDYCLWLDILLDGYTAVGCTEILTDWRLIMNSRSFNKKKAARNRWRIYRHHLHFSVGKSVRYFLSYAWHGVMKYIR